MAEVTPAGHTLPPLSPNRCGPHCIVRWRRPSDLTLRPYSLPRSPSAGVPRKADVLTGSYGLTSSHMLIPARALADLARVRVDARELAALAKPLGCEGCYLFSLETREPSAVAHVRAFFPF